MGWGACWFCQAEFLPCCSVPLGGQVELLRAQATAVFSYSWRTMSTSLWTPKTSACHPPCLPVRGYLQLWRPSIARPPMTGQGTGREAGP